MRHLLEFDAGGALRLEEQVREEAHGEKLMGLPLLAAETHRDEDLLSELFRVEARGDVQRERVVLRGEGRPGEGCVAQRRAWRGGELVLAPEASRALRWSRDEAVDALHEPFWEVAEGVRVLPLRTPTLPPATHTNAFLVGEGELLFIEPAPGERAECDALIAVVERLDSPLVAIALTHHHVDHVGGAAYLAERLSAPLWAHEETARSLPALTFERHLVDGELLRVGGKVLRVVHTPGHARGHLCFADEESSLLIAGDMVAGVGTILIEPGDGDMNEYLRQLERLEGLGLKRLVPAHGGLVVDGPGLCRRTREHRQGRDAKVAAVPASMSAEDPAALDALLPAVYADVPRALYPLARLSLLAHLEAMEKRGEAQPVAGGWCSSLADQGSK